MKLHRLVRGCVKAVMAAVLLFSLGVSVHAAQPAVVKIWNYNVHDKKYQQKMYKLFNQRNPNIKIEYTSLVSTVYSQILEAAVVAKDMPDLFLFGTGYALTLEYLRTHNLVIPLNDCAPSDAELKDWMSKFPANLRKFVEGVTVFGGKPYAIDLSGRSGAAYILPVFYNKTLFRQAGIAKPPTTFSELRQIAAKATSAGAGEYFGVVRGGIQPGWSWDLVWMAAHAGARGLWSLDLKDGKHHWGSPELKLAFDVWINMRKDGSIFPGDMQMVDEQAKMAFATNKAALEFGGSWNIGGYFAYNPECDFDLVFPPVPDTGQKGWYARSDAAEASGYLVSKATKNPKAVWEVIKFISSLEYQDGWVQGGYGVSYLPEANRPENYASLPQMYKFVQWGNNDSLFRVAPVLAEEAQKVETYMPGVYPISWDALNNIYEGYAGYETLLDLDKRLNAALDEGIKNAQAAGLKVTRADFAFPDWDPTKDYVQKKK